MRDDRISPLLILLMAVVAGGLAVSCFFLPGGSADASSGIVGTAWLSVLLAVACIGATVVSMGILNSDSFLFTSDGRLLYLPYLLVAFSVTGAIHFSFFHVAAILTVWSVFLAARYLNSEKVRMDSIFGAMLISGAASMALPSVMYMQVMIFLYCLFRRRHDFMRYLLASVAGAAVPWLYILVWGFVFPSRLSFVDFAGNYMDGIAVSLPEPASLTVHEHIWYSFLLLLAVRSAVFVLGRMRERNKAQKNAFGLSVALSVVSVLAAVFCGWPEEPLASIAFAVPVSLVVFDFFSGAGRARVTVWIVLLVLLAAAQRVLEFFPAMSI